MMYPLIKYMLASYTRSYRYFAPIAFILISTLFIYSYRPNPVMDSYAVTSAILFIGSAWLGLNFLNHDQGRQAMLLIIHAGSAKRYYCAQYLTINLITVALYFFALVYPILTGMFDRPVTGNDLLLGFLGHALLALLGVTLSLFFQFGWIENQGRAAGMLLIVMICSLAGQSVVNKLPVALEFVPYLLPPVSVMINMMIHNEGSLTLTVILTCVYCLLYSVALLVIYMTLSIRKDAAALIRKVG
ncbi:hypothetical protein JCM10914A_53870 [Paenibacillus sp. JCM 10914]